MPASLANAFCVSPAFFRASRNLAPKRGGSLFKDLSEFDMSPLEVAATPFDLVGRLIGILT